jgi:transcriptional regulator with XRE-family HTH domain
MSGLRTAGEVHEQDLRDPQYRREYERTQLANDIAIEVIRYRAEHNLTQAELGRMIGMRQPHVARLEAGDHEPSLATLARLSHKLGLDLSIDIKPDRLGLRHHTRGRKRPTGGEAVGQENAVDRRAG